MKSRTSFFNFGIYRNIIRRTWPLWAAYFLCWFFPMPLITLVERMESTGTVPASVFLPSYLSDGLNGTLMDASAISGFVVAILAAYAVFSFLHTARGSGLIASLPVRREAVFTSAYMAGLIPVIVINLIIAVINAAATIGAKVSFSVVVSANAFWLVINTMEYVCFYGIAVIIAMITANNVALPVLYGIFNFLIVGMATVICSIFSEFIFGYSSNASAFEFTSPLVMLSRMDKLVSDDTRYLYFSAFRHWDIVTLYFVLGIVLSVIALLLFRRHKMESAGDVVAIPALRPVFKYGVAVCSSLCFSLLLYIIIGDAVPGRSFGLIVLGAGLIIGAFMGYFASEMFICKSLHVFRGKWGGFAVLAVLCVVFTFCTAINVFGLATHLPDASEVKNAYCYECNVELKTQEDIAEFLRINKAILDNGTQYIDALDGNVPIEDTAYVSFAYKLQSGKEIYRTYTILNDENFAAYRKLLNKPEYVLQYFEPTVEVSEKNISDAVISVYLNPDLKDKNGDPYAFVSPAEDEYGNVYADPLNIILTPEQAVDFYTNAFMPDIEAGNISNPIVSYMNPTVFEINISLFSESGSWDSFRAEFDDSAVNCIRWLCDNFG